MLVMLIITEIFALSFCFAEIYNTNLRLSCEENKEAIMECVTNPVYPETIRTEAQDTYEAYLESKRWKGPVLSARIGTVTGPSGKETYYNLNMSGVVKIMRRMGNNDEYWVREDGCKMLGDYIMVAANLDLRPRGSIVETSLGDGIVCDTGGFAKKNPTQLDIATNW